MDQKATESRYPQDLNEHVEMQAFIYIEREGKVVLSEANQYVTKIIKKWRTSSHLDWGNQQIACSYYPHREEPFLTG